MRGFENRIVFQKRKIKNGKKNNKKRVESNIGKKNVIKKYISLYYYIVHVSRDVIGNRVLARYDLYWSGRGGLMEDQGRSRDGIGNAPINTRRASARSDGRDRSKV